MKKSILFLAIITVMSLSVAAMAASPVVKVRVVDVSVLGQDEVSSPAGLTKTAAMSIAENAKVFPTIGTMVLSVGTDKAKYTPDVTLPAGALSFSGSITQAEMLEFISIPNPEGAGKYDGALVSRDGKITYLDEPIVIDYKLKTIATPKSFTVKDGDVLLLFVKGSDPNPIGHEKGVANEYGYQPHGTTMLNHDTDHQGGPDKGHTTKP
jgi:hypothetical protein